MTALRWYFAWVLALCLAIVGVASAHDHEPRAAVIRFDEAQAIYVRDLDGEWVAWVAGASAIVNGPFLDRYAPTPTPTPTPTPDPADGYTGFTVAGSGTQEVRLPDGVFGELQCSSWARGAGVVSFGVWGKNMYGQAGRRYISVSHPIVNGGDKTYPHTSLFGRVSDRGNYHEVSPVVGPFTLKVETSLQASWGVSCQP